MRVPCCLCVASGRERDAYNYPELETISLFPSSRGRADVALDRAGGAGGRGPRAGLAQLGWPDDGDRCTPARRRPRDEARYRYEAYWCDGGLRVYEQHEVRDAVHEVSRVVG